MKNKHNKKRNVGLMYEFLLRHISSCLIEGKSNEAKKVTKILERRFNKNTELWKNLPGNNDRKEHIQYCIDQCNSLFRTIMIIPEKKGVFDETREIKNAKPFDAAWFKILEFNPDTGEFKAKSIKE